VKDWNILNTSTTYENNWIKVDHHEVITPSGNHGIYGKVNFKNTAMGIVALDEENYIWLVGQYRFTLDEYSWEIPEGGCPEGEDIFNGAVRELKEETGIIAKKWTYIGKVHTSNSVTDEVGYIYLAQDLIYGEPDPEETENLSLKKVHINEALRMVMENEITDSISAIAILKVHRLISNNAVNAP
jgi:8-oxo-dGTP pyrophosphatase MutT (NUDIX family)